MGIMSEALEIQEGLILPASDLSITAVRASGPGGQNVNKVASKVELRFDLERSEALSEEVKERLRRLAKNRLDSEGRLFLTSQKTRDQLKNVEDARQKLRALILQALEAPRPRKKTRPSRASVERRLAEKRERARIKQERARRPEE